jgi:hypothetical protein
MGRGAWSGVKTEIRTEALDASGAFIVCPVAGRMLECIAASWRAGRLLGKTGDGVMGLGGPAEI